LTKRFFSERTTKKKKKKKKSHDKRQSFPFLHSRARGRAPPRAEDGAQALPAW
jgi:hypothetical protein